MATATNSIRLPKPKQPRAPRPSSSVPPFPKHLSSSEFSFFASFFGNADGALPDDKPVRDKAVAALSRFLAGHSKKLGPDGEELEEILSVGELNWEQEWVVDARLAAPEMAKLWKGIFFCSSPRCLRPIRRQLTFFFIPGFWMSDKPLVQQALADNLSNLTLEVRASKKNSSGQGRVARFRSALEYLRGFWDAIVREWGGLDRLRLDKFYLLIRRFVGVGFKLLAREEWDLTAIAEYNNCLTGPGGPLQCVTLPRSHSRRFADDSRNSQRSRFSNSSFIGIPSRRHLHRRVGTFSSISPRFSSPSRPPRSASPTFPHDIRPLSFLDHVRSYRRQSLHSPLRLLRPVTAATEIETTKDRIAIGRHRVPANLRAVASGGDDGQRGSRGRSSIVR